MANITTVRDVPDLLAILEEAFFDIPFENSDYQNRAFVLAAQQTPARAFRALGLRMFSKIRAVKEYKFSQEKNQIDIDENNAKIENPATNEFDKRRARLEISKIEDEQRWGEKLLNDALRELDCLYAEFVKYPHYTREQFEAEETTHFAKKLQRALQASGPMESLLTMKDDLPAMDKRIADSAKLLLEGK